MKILNIKDLSVLLCLCFALSLSFVNLQAQISGKVVDVEHVPLPYAIVLLLNPIDSSLVLGAITDEKGNYDLYHTQPGDYLLSVSMVGYQDTYSDLFQISNNENTFKLPIIKLKNATALLDEVVVVEKRALFEQKIDRLVVNIANSITLSGSTALDVLKRSPGVVVNPQSNSIAMSGKDGVIVMINGKISRMPEDAIVQMLSGMNADNIKSIELIHTPPANFDAEGNAGFINIVMKKNQEEGLNGGFSLNAGYGQKEKSGASINFNSRKNKINIFGDYAWKYNHNPQLITSERSFERNDILFETNTELRRDPTRTHVQNARLGIDIQLTDKTVIGALISMSTRDWSMNGVANIQNFENKLLVNRSFFPSEEDNSDRTYVANINLQHQFTKNQRLNIDIDYATFFNNNPSSYTNQLFDGKDNLLSETQLRVSKETPLDIWVGKIDYTHNFGDNLVWEMGLKGTASAFDNDVSVDNFNQNVWERVDLFSSEATLDERIAATYTALSWKLTSKTDLKLGLRYEFSDLNLSTVTDPNIVDRTNGRLFPSLFISNSINKDNRIQFSYSRRINRPSFRQLAPFFFFIDPSTVITGNATLRSSISDALRATYSWKTLQMNVAYTYTDNLIGQFQPTINTTTNTQIFGAKNFKDGHLASISLSLPWAINDWWELRSNWAGQWAKINDVMEGRSISITNSSWNVNGSSTFSLPNKYTLEVTGNYFSPSLSGAVLFQDFHSINIGIQKELNKNRGTIKFSVNDIFKGNNWEMILDNPDFDFTSHSLLAFTERVFRVTYSKRFGNTKVKGERRRSTGSAEEQRRVK